MVCKHNHKRIVRFAVPIRPGIVPPMITMTRKQCVDCGHWLPLGPSLDTTETAIEVRAAELAARPGFGSFANCGKGCERCGYVQQGSGNDRNVRCKSDEWHAGYLARTIADHREAQ